MEKYVINKEKDEEKKINFFSSPKITSIAIDVSGSTYGTVMSNQKEIISSLISGTNCENLQDTIIAWDDKCKIDKLKNLDSNGCTDPSCIFQKLEKNVENLVITTDGEIPKGEVDKTRKVIQSFTNLKNIICLSFQDSVSSPSNLNIAVFYPFLEHTKKMKGSFYLFYYKNKQLCLLLKNIPKMIDTIFDSPPLEYNNETKWEDIPKYETNDIKKIEVMSLEALEEGHI